MSDINVRFLNNFVLVVVTTGLNDEGRMQATEVSFHVARGDTYPIEQYERHPDDKLDLHFPDSCPMAGVAHRVEGDYCELTEPAKIAAKPSGGCGGCGNRGR